MESSNGDLTQEMKEIMAKANDRNLATLDNIARKLGQATQIEVTKDIEGEE